MIPRVTLTAMCIAVALPLAVRAATPEEAKCLASLEAAKQAEQRSHASHAIYEKSRSEADRCAFLGTSKVHAQAMKKAGEACKAFDLATANYLIATANEVLPAITKESGCRTLR
jgi:hypothetical protein